MFISNDSPQGWTPERQRLHSLYWSCFLGVPRIFDTDRFDKRYDPSTTGQAAQLLMAHWNGDLQPAIRRSFRKIALWTLAPSILEPPETPRDKPDPRRQDVDLTQLVGPFRDTFRRHFGFEPGADRAWDPSRFLVPELPELGIEGTSVETLVLRRSVRIRTTTIVTRRFDEIAGMVHPSSWGSCPFWAGLPAGTPGAFPKTSPITTIRAAVRLPGGNLLPEDGSDKSKRRDVDFRFALSVSPFEARIDYDGKEPGHESGLGDGLDGPPVPFELRPPVEIGGFRGFLKVEKTEGRPHTCRVTAEREVRYRHFNHDHFRAETTHYWLASELVAFLDDAERRRS